MKAGKRFLILVLCVLIAYSLSGCGDSESAKGQNVELTFATGGAGGPMHVIGSAICSLWNDKVENVNVTNSSTAASVVNCNMTNEGNVQLAFTMSDVAYLGSRGEEMFKKPLDNIMGFTSLHTNYVQIITKRNSGIKSIQDLKGKRVGVGAPGSGTEFNARCILGAADMTYKDLAKADFLSYAETCEQLANGNIDAGFLTGGLPISAISELATVQDIDIIPVDQDLIDKLMEDYPIYFQSEIPGELYRGIAQPVRSVALKNYIIINKDADEDLTYELIKTMYENWDRIKQSHSALAEVTPEMAVDRMELPLHPGVERYFKEKGIM